MFLAKTLQASVAGQAAGGAYIEDVFSTWLFPGTASGTSSNIVNGIDLSGEGGLVWMKNRTSSENHFLYDTARGNTVYLSSNTTSANSSYTGVTFNGDGFTQDMGFGTSVNVASWTFRKAPKFFDVVTYTGTGANRTVSHNLGSVPGCIIVKRLDDAADWNVYHRSLTSASYRIWLNLTDAQSSTPTAWNSTAPTDSVFSLGTNTNVNASGGSYVAYLFAHDAGGFGDSGEENVISCGSIVYSNGNSVNFGWEPQWILFKRTDGLQDWFLVDTMRSWTADGNATWLRPNTANADSGIAQLGFSITSTGFKVTPGYGNGASYVYIAIRRGPMKTPESGTEVFSPQVQTPTGSSDYVMASSSGFPIDWLPTRKKGIVSDWYQTSRLTNNYMSPNTSAAEGAYTYGFGLMQGVSAQWDASSTVSYAFRRAPGFFDVVTYTGTGVSGLVVNHNLGVTPELLIYKRRDNTTSWFVTTTGSDYGVLNGTDAFSSGLGISLGSTNYTINQSGASTNANGGTYVAYLFASCPGVSKVGSYTGTGTTLQVNCGFSSGARFVLIKRTDSTGDWYVWDSARGIVAGNDPYLLLNSTAAEVTSTDYVDTYSAGFEISSTAPAAINANGGTFIFLAIA